MENLAIQAEQQTPPTIQILIDNAVQEAIQATQTAINEKLDEIIAHTAKTAARAALGALERDEIKRQQEGYDRKLHNTKLLLKNYRKLSEYFQNAIIDLDDAEEVDASFDTVMRLMRNRDDSDDLIVESLQKSHTQTRIIMAHVEKMLNVYADLCERSPHPEDARRWRCLYYMYISDVSMTAEEIAEQENIDRRTVYKDLNVCFSDLTALLFGVTGLEKVHIY